MMDAGLEQVLNSLSETFDRISPDQQKFLVKCLELLANMDKLDPSYFRFNYNHTPIQFPRFELMD